MYYRVSCPKCGKDIVVYNNEPDAPYDSFNILFHLVKDHYKEWHTQGDLLLTDEELFDYIKANMRQSEDVPENAVEGDIPGAEDLQNTEYDEPVE